MSLRWGVDLDGVCVDFNSAYIQLIKDITGKQLPTPGPDYPTCWNYAAKDGITPEEDDKVWDHIKQAENYFWAKLPAYPGTKDALGVLLDRRYEGDEIYFITSRPGAKAKFQSELWLRRNGFPDPTVLVTSDKGPVAKGLKLDIFIDDKPENCADVALASPNTAVYMVKQPYNRDFVFEGDYRIKPIESVQAVIDLYRFKLQEAA